MKRKTRIITVNNQKYVWWFGLGELTSINISPLNDKTATVTINFICENTTTTSPYNYIYLGEYPVECYTVSRVDNHLKKY